MDMNMHDGYGHAEWTKAFTMDKFSSKKQGHAACTWTCSMDWTWTIDMYLHHGQHTQWTLTCTMDMDMQHLHGHAVWT
jgi:hypothetical protein